MKTVARITNSGTFNNSGLLINLSSSQLINNSGTLNNDRRSRSIQQLVNYEQWDNCDIAYLSTNQRDNYEPEWRPVTGMLELEGVAQVLVTIRT